MGLKGNRRRSIGHCPHLWNPQLQPIHHSQQSYCLWYKYNELVSHNQGLCCAGWNGCSGDFHRCGQYPMDLLRLPLGKLGWMGGPFSWAWLNGAEWAWMERTRATTPTNLTCLDNYVTRQSWSFKYLAKCPSGEVFIFLFHTIWFMFLRKLLKLLLTDCLTGWVCPD